MILKCSVVNIKISESKHLQKFTLSVAALITANIIPIFGVSFLKWPLFPLILLYWLENAVIGSFNMLKIITNRSHDSWNVGQKLFMIPFFLIHYGGLFLIHGFAIMQLFGGNERDVVEIFSVSRVFEVVYQYGLQFALFGLILSHGFSFFTNYIRRGEWQALTLGELMLTPYIRIIVLHLFIIFGGFIILKLGSPHSGIIILAVLKTVADLFAHCREHYKQVSNKEKSS